MRSAGRKSTPQLPSLESHGSVELAEMDAELLLPLTTILDSAHTDNSGQTQTSLYGPFSSASVHRHLRYCLYEFLD